MGFSDWFRKKTPLQLALQRGLSPGKSLADELREMGTIQVKSRADAEAVCHVLEAMLKGELPKSPGWDGPFRAVTRLFQDVESLQCEAFPVLRNRGLPLLVEAVTKALNSGDKDAGDEVLFLLKILAMYGTRRGAELIVQLAHQGFQHKQWLWNVILGAFGENHPETRYVFSALSDPLPPGFIAVSLLDSSNRFFLKGGEARHPFDSDQGIARLKAWLKNPNEEKFSYAISAAAALPFLGHEGVGELLELASRHPGIDVRLEGAWAAAKSGLESGIEQLAAMCRDLRISERACSYLKELERTEAIPSLSPDFSAQSRFVQWLSHPNELGQAPDEITIYDHRKLHWPPDFAERPLWLLRYCVHDKTGLEPDDIGVGLVGSTTWCFFNQKLDQRPPEDGYALHCTWELERKQIALHEVESGSTEYDGLIAQWRGAALAGVCIEEVAELDRELRHPQRLVAVARASQAGQAGWVVLDGPTSWWYPAEEAPEGERSATVLRIHLGRRLLQMSLEAERGKYLQPRQLPGHATVIHAYETLMRRWKTFPPVETATALQKLGKTLSRHFGNYVSARVAEHQVSRAETIVTTYETLLQVARSAGSAHETASPVDENFEIYIEALLELGRSSRALEVVREFTAFWDHNLGYGRLGTAAFKAGDFPLAETLLLKLKAGMKAWARHEAIPLLAEIWLARGQASAARELLFETLRHTLDEAANASGSDLDFHERIYQRQRLDFLRIFADPEALTALPETVKG